MAYGVVQAHAAQSEVGREPGCSKKLKFPFGGKPRAIRKREIAGATLGRRRENVCESWDVSVDCGGVLGTHCSVWPAV